MACALRRYGVTDSGSIYLFIYLFFKNRNKYFIYSHLNFCDTEGIYKQIHRPDIKIKNFMC
ncbi:MAG: hypothetical protein P8X89_19455 [Reinekea sp.]